MQPFALRRRVRVLRHNPVAMSMFPAYTFEAIFRSLRTGNPRHPRSSNPCGSKGRLLRRSTCPHRSEHSPAVLKLSLPLRTLRSRRLVALSLTPPKKPAFANRPIFRHSPQGLNVTISAAADHYSRSATTRQACWFLRTSWNHLHHAPNWSVSQQKSEVIH